MRVKRLFASLVLTLALGLGGVAMYSVPALADPGMPDTTGGGGTFSDGTSASEMPSGMQPLDDQYANRDCGVTGIHGDYIISSSVNGDNCQERRCIDTGRTFTNADGVEFSELECRDYYYPNYVYSENSGPAWRSATVQGVRYRNKQTGEVVVNPGPAPANTYSYAYYCPDGSVYYY